jgi:hypothetical protein
MLERGPRRETAPAAAGVPSADGDPVRPARTLVCDGCGELRAELTQKYSRYFGLTMNTDKKGVIIIILHFSVCF